MRESDWQLGWWAPGPPAAQPDDLIDPQVHGPLLAAAANGSPLDAPGRHRLDALKAAGLALPDGRPRFPVADAERAKPVRDVAGDLGAAVARLVAGEWSRLQVEYEPVPVGRAGPGDRSAGFLVVGGLLLDVGVRRRLRREGLAAPPLGSAFVWLVQGEPGMAGIWRVRVTALPGRGSLVRFGPADAPDWSAAAADPEAAPALPAGREPALRELVEALAWSVARLVDDWVPALDPARRRIPGADDQGAFLAWAYSLAVDAALAALAARGLVAPPPGRVLAVRVADPALAGA